VRGTRSVGHHEEHGPAQRLGSSERFVLCERTHRSRDELHCRGAVDLPVRDEQRPCASVEEHTRESRQSLSRFPLTGAAGGPWPKHSLDAVAQIAYQTSTREVKPVRNIEVIHAVQLFLLTMQPSWTMPRYLARNLNAPLAIASQM
jgi:hypothetical protein